MVWMLAGTAVLVGGAGAVYGGSMMMTGHAPLACGGMMRASCANAPEGDVRVSMRFDPPSLMVRQGRTVTWANVDTVAHTVTSDDPSGPLDSGLLAPGASWSFTFSQPGRYAYHCVPHSAQAADGSWSGMVARVIVTSS